MAICRLNVELYCHLLRFCDKFLSNFLQIITSAIPDSVGKKLIGLVTSRDEIPDLLKV